MAKTVGDLLIKLGVDGIEGVTQLKSALTGLSKAAGPADAGRLCLLLSSPARHGAVRFAAYNGESRTQDISGRRSTVCHCQHSLPILPEWKEGGGGYASDCGWRVRILS